MNAHKKTAARFTAAAFGVVILAISASTSFAFFYNYFSNLIPPGVLGPAVAALISGIVGTLLFDVASVVWLQTYLNDAKTPEQRAISLIMLIVTFVGAAAASVAHLSLSATGELALDAATLGSIATVALVTVIIGVIANFGSVIAYQRFSKESKDAVRESDRSDVIQKAEDAQLDELDVQLDKEVRDVLADMVPDLARQQAARIAARIARREGAKYGGNENSGETAVSPTAAQQPTPAQSGNNHPEAFTVEWHYNGRSTIISKQQTFDESMWVIGQQTHAGIYKIVLEGRVVYSTSRPQPPSEAPSARPTQAAANNGSGRSSYQPE